jgi:uncharacterized protein (DUF488 family)
MTIYTLGYSGWKIEDAQAVLERLNAILVDVRMVPRTRWTPAWNSSVLHERLGDASAGSTGSPQSDSLQAGSPQGRYVWLKEFGNKNYKGTFEQIEIADFPAGEQRLREMLGMNPSSAASSGASGPASPGSVVSSKAVVLMCGCRDVNICHRKVVAQRLAELWGAEVVHLAAPAKLKPEIVGQPKLF